MIDVFNHILPPEYLSAADRLLTNRYPLMFERARQIPAMSDIEARLRVMDGFAGYRQILSLSSPTVDTLASGTTAIELARCANNALAKLVDLFPDRFPGFVA